jgi:Brp/Blh family beta-carotene 15,15'-monooxygenase
MVMARTWMQSHARLALAATVIAVGTWQVLPATASGMPFQLVVLAAFVAVLGLPHGAVDHIEGRRLLAPRFGRGWSLVFGAGYALAALAVVAAWAIWPPVLLTAFLLLAIGHFGGEDTASLPLAPPPPNPWGVAEAALRGALPVLLPILFHPEATGRLFAALLPETSPGETIAALHTLAPLGWLYLAALGGLALSALGCRRTLLAAELAVLVGAFWALPPLMGFIVYFCIWHAPRHSLSVMAEGPQTAFREALATFTRAAWPLTALTLVAAAVVWAMRWIETSGAVATLQVVFIGLAALTVPHVLLAAWHRRATSSI